MTVLLLVLRLALAVVFAAAGVAKLLDRRGAYEAARRFGASPAIARPLAVGLPVAELGTAALLVPAKTGTVGAIAAAVLLAAFSAAIAAALVRGERPDCACFGRVASSPVGPATLARNAALGVAAIAVAVAGPGTGLTDVRIGAVWASLSALTAAVALLSAIAWQLFRQNGRLVERLRVVEDALGTRSTGGLAIGDSAPTVETTEGPLDELLAEGSPVALVFTQTGCGACDELAPRVDRLRRRRGGPLRIALVHDNPTAVRDYGIDVVPSAVLLDRAGRVASAVAAGAFAVERFLAAAASAEAPEREARVG